MARAISCSDFSQRWERAVGPRDPATRFGRTSNPTGTPAPYCPLDGTCCRPHHAVRHRAVAQSQNLRRLTRGTSQVRFWLSTVPIRSGNSMDQHVDMHVEGKFVGCRKEAVGKSAFAAMSRARGLPPNARPQAWRRWLSGAAQAQAQTALFRPAEAPFRLAEALFWPGQCGGSSALSTVESSVAASVWDTTTTITRQAGMCEGRAATARVPFGNEAARAFRTPRPGRARAKPLIFEFLTRKLVPNPYVTLSPRAALRRYRGAPAQAASCESGL